MADSNTQDVLSSTVQRLLRPLARFLLKRGFSYAAFAEAAKHAFVDAASSDFAIPGKRPTTSRISTLTGLSRKEVFRLQKMTDPEQDVKQPKLNRAARVINGWIADSRFTDSGGKPKRLEFDQGENTFTQLVKEYSGDITPRTIVDELSRIDAIEVDKSGKLHLKKKAYIPEAGSDERINMLADDVISLFTTIEHNLDNVPPDSKRFQRKVYYDRIPVKQVTQLKAMIDERAQACLEDINLKLREYDTDTTAAQDAEGKMKLGLGIYYIEEKTP